MSEAQNESDESLLKTIEALSRTVGDLRAQVEEFKRGRKDPKFAARFMSDYVNTLASSNEKSFAGEMAREHRTLQQNFTRLCVAWLEHLASEDHYDLRNEASVKLAQQFVSQIPAEVRHLPTI